MSASRNLLKHMLARALTCCDVSCMRHNCLEQLMLMRETVQETDTTARTLSTVYMKGSRSATSLSFHSKACLHRMLRASVWQAGLLRFLVSPKEPMRCLALCALPLSRTRYMEIEISWRMAVAPSSQTQRSQNRAWGQVTGNHLCRACSSQQTERPTE
jgi:hypothetical protein